MHMERDRGCRVWEQGGGAGKSERESCTSMRQSFSLGGWRPVRQMLD